MMSDDQTDILFSRVIDGRDTAADWQALETLGTQDPDLWRTLALAQRDHRAIVAGVRRATDVADGIALPSAEPARHRHSFHARAKRTSAWAGWAAAAMLAIAFVGRTMQSPSQDIGAGATASLEQPFADAASALQSYLSKGRENGRVVTERPMRLLGLEQLPDGAGYRVLYERPIVESAVLGSPSIVHRANLRLQ
jgi:hypothetical protein